MNNGIKVIDYFSNGDFRNANNSKTEIDLAIAVGGDGTTLRTFRTLSPGIPVFGTRGAIPVAGT